MTAKKQDENKLGKYVFRIRVPTHSKQLFSMTVNFVTHEYTLVDGETYDLPQFIVDFIHSFYHHEVFDIGDGKIKEIKIQKYFCEPVA